eukprot:Rhum_TRINITY_DN14884_c0_g1::Rhum_TRINITY_DN14884_c0_g1_i1::g.119552::m.119552
MSQHGSESHADDDRLDRMLAQAGSSQGIAELLHGLQNDGEWNLEQTARDPPSPPQPPVASSEKPPLPDTPASVPASHASGGGTTKRAKRSSRKAAAAAAASPLQPPAPGDRSSHLLPSPATPATDDPPAGAKRGWKSLRRSVLPDPATPVSASPASPRDAWVAAAAGLQQQEGAKHASKKYKQSLDLLLVKFEEAQKERDAAEAEVKKLKRQNNKLRSDLEQWEEKDEIFTAAQKQLKDFRERLKKADAAALSAAEDLAAVTARTVELQAAAGRADEDAGRRVAAAEEARQAEAERAVLDAGGLRAQVESLERRAGELRAANEELRAKEAEGAARCVRVEQELAAAKEDTARVRQEEAARAREVEELRLRLHEARGDAKDGETLAAALRESVARAEAEAEARLRAAHAEAAAAADVAAAAAAAAVEAVKVSAAADAATAAEHALAAL